MKMTYWMTACLFIISLFTASHVWAQNVETADASSVTEQAMENMIMIKSWQQGFDVRLNIGPGFGSTKNFYVCCGTCDPLEYMIGFHGDFEIGYRWKYGGIYLKNGIFAYRTLIDYPEGIEDDTGVGATNELYAYGRGFIPVTENVEITLGIGLGMQYLGDNRGLLSLPISAGGIWHVDAFYLGGELRYTYSMYPYEWSEWNHSQDVYLTFMLGYTF